MASALQYYGQTMPDVSPETYRSRARTLETAGFLDFEVFWLSAHKLDSPGARAMIDDRRMKFRFAKSIKMSKDDYKSDIRARYGEEGWSFNNGAPNPFKMLEFYKKQKDAPDTPQPKRRRIKKDFIAIKKKGLERDKLQGRPAGSIIFRPPKFPF